MQYTTLGRTGLEVSVAGLGCGGFSQLGKARGNTDRQAADVVRAAMDLGVNFIDTAETYGTEEAVGLAIAGSRRDRAVLSTKTQIFRAGTLRTADEVVASLHGSLKRLGTERVDVYHLHGVRPEHVGYAVEHLVPALLREVEAGRIGHLGITETSPNDFEHRALLEALEAGVFEVMMLGFHLMHQNARRELLPRTIESRTGTLGMFVVRQVFSQPGLIEQTLRTLVEAGELPAEYLADEALDFLAPGRGAPGLVEAAYRFARHEPGMDVVLFGTGRMEHLEPNVNAILAPALPQAVRARVARDFGHLLGVGLVAPKH